MTDPRVELDQATFDHLKSRGLVLPKMVQCPGSFERSDRVHSSGGLLCPSCNGVYLSSGMTVPRHDVEAEQ